MIDFLMEQKEWLFSGIGVAAGGWFLRRIMSSNSKNVDNKIYSGKKSTNIISDGDVNVTINRGNNE